MFRNLNDFISIVVLVILNFMSVKIFITLLIGEEKTGNKENISLLMKEYIDNTEE